MIPIHERTFDDDDRFDLLVDGELPESERRELLSRLDHEPDGWRRCALAFLEAQCWKQELGAAMRPAREPVRPRHRRPGPRRTWQQWVETAVAVAASFLLALGLGIKLRDAGYLGGPGRPAGDAVAQNLGGAMPGPGYRQVWVPLAMRPPAASPDNWELVTLNAPPGPEGKRATVHVPVVQRPALDPKWLESVPAAVPPEVLQAFAQAGHEVRQHRELVPVELKDGRRLVVPMDRVEVQYVGRPAL